MRPFRFSLAALLKFRESIRDERRAELAVVQREADSLDRLRSATLSQLEYSKSNRRAESAPGVISARRLAEFHRYEAALVARSESLRRQREDLEPELERRRRAVVEADREVRSLEKLRHRRLEEHRQAETRAEAKALDELGVSRRAS